MKLKNVEIFLQRKYIKTFEFTDNREENKPLTQLKKPLKDSKLALVTSAGLYKKDQKPFDTEALLGDTSYRVIGKNDTLETLGIAHTHYDHQFIKADINTVYPMDLLERYSNDTFASLADQHYSFCGFVLDTDKLITETAQGILEELIKDKVDVVLLAPV